jgi:hypothetical protein
LCLKAFMELLSDLSIIPKILLILSKIPLCSLRARETPDLIGGNGPARLA